MCYTRDVSYHLVCFLEQETRVEWGVLKNVLYGEALPPSPTLFPSFYTVLTEKAHLSYTFTGKGTLFIYQKDMTYT